MIGDGRSLIALSGVCLGLAGMFAIFQSLTGHFMPHDTAYLRMQPEELCGINERLSENCHCHKTQLT